MYTFLRFPDFKRKAVTLSYDDCTIHDRRLIEVMDRYGLKGTFNIDSGMFGKEALRLTKDEALSLYRNTRHEIAVHGANHISLGQVDSAMATRDIIADRENLEKMFGCIIKGMAYANGSVNDRAVEVLKSCGIKYARTCASTENFNIPTDWLRMPSTCHHDNPRLMELTKFFVECNEPNYFWANSPMLFYLWGHSFEFELNHNWDVIERFASFIGNREDVWYATNGEIYDYVQAYNRLEYSVDGTIIYNPTDKDIYLYYFKQYIKVPAMQTLKLDSIKYF